MNPPRRWAKCYFCRRWHLTVGKIKVDPTEGPSEWTEGHVCDDCKSHKRHESTNTEVRLGNRVEYPKENYL